MRFPALVVAAAVGSAVAQRPSNTSICDYYTTALLKNNTAAHQKALLTLVVNTAVIGNYTTPNVGIKVPGILTAGEYNGTAVDLLPYFSGGLASSNAGGSSGVSVNFLDGGGAAPLTKSLPADDMNSRQYTLLTHLYEIFGALLGCSLQGGDQFSTYNGHASMYSVHKFMDLSAADVGYFITQVGLSAASFGVADADVTAVGKALNSAFGYRCSPEETIIPSQGPQLQAICTDDTCPEATNATCSSYGIAVEPKNATSTSGASSNGSATGTSPNTSSTSSPTVGNTASAIGMSFVVAAAGFFAAFL
ncbi:hypothetical protein B7494_g4635 [Chlorociboria aeruginascens]|nr:hypothetical protein B7494_g4635 [Chlorociboria aeruginascens]